MGCASGQTVSNGWFCRFFASARRTSSSSAWRITRAAIARKCGTLWKFIRSSFISRIAASCASSVGCSRLAAASRRIRRRAIARMSW